jgi:hypothetical protein
MVESVIESKYHVQEVKREAQQERAAEFWRGTIQAGRAVRQASQAQREEKKETPSRKLKP